MSLFLTGCRDASEQPVSAPDLPQPSLRPRRKHPLYTPDTAAILSNKNLIRLLSAVLRDSLVEYEKASAIPPVILAFLHQNDSLYNQPFALADYGQRYSAGCLVEKDLPRRQLRYLGVGQRTVVLTYNVGGVGVYTRVLLFEIKQNSVVDFWTDYLGNQAADKQGIIAQLLRTKDAEWRQYSKSRLAL
ncbi:hypothetical protein ACFPAF_00075 [Hymenobacter endophyticus]|nr:hypothetical protein [Hymenobacter endophyticus]